MKKICLYLLLCLAATQLKAQQGVVFKIKYLPEHTYQSNTNINMKLTATLSGNQQEIDKLNAMGIKQPISANLSLGLNGIIKSGAVSADKSFPVSFDYKLGDVSIKANGKDFPIPQNKNKDIKLYAHINQDGVLKVDSAEGKKVSDTSQKKMEQMMSMFQRNINFPDKALKPGDTFTQAMPINIPMKGMDDTKIDVNVTYKLISIADGKANFDIAQAIAIKLQMKKGIVNIAGTGSGKMVYSINDNFPVSFNSALDMKINATMDKTVVNGTAVINMDQATVIN